jgi:hypothetical protein
VRAQETLVDAMWALSYITDGDNDKIQVRVTALCIVYVCIVRTH